MMYSLVVPVFNSADNIGILCNQFKITLIDKGFNAELILVDDASGNETRMKAAHLASENSFVKTILLKSNVGQLAATTCGIHHAAGDIIITMDDDLQYPMEEIPRFIRYFHSRGKQLVFGFPSQRMHSMNHRIAAQVVIWLFRHIVLPSHKSVNFYTSFRIFRRSLFFNPDNSRKHTHLFYVWEIPASQMSGIPVRHLTRQRGKSTYTFAKKINTLKPVIFFSVSKISLPALIILLFFSTWSLFADSTGFFWILAAGCVLSFLLLLFSKHRVANLKAIKYEVEKIVTGV